MAQHVTPVGLGFTKEKRQENTRTFAFHKHVNLLIRSKND